MLSFSVSAIVRMRIGCFLKIIYLQKYNVKNKNITYLFLF
uniref:Uncharacterized protein n=1 Tax=Anguilla anguilla TaxID=7936 RepID=A0A0E9P5Z1_ANGAN